MKLCAKHIIVCILITTLLGACRPDDETVDFNPVAAFSYSVVDNKVTFFNEGSDYESLLWEFGDGETSTETNPTHVYNDRGSYTVFLRLRFPKSKKREGENLYPTSETKVSISNNIGEVFTSQNIAISFEAPVRSVIAPEFVIGYSHIRPNITLGSASNGTLTFHVEWALDENFTQPAAGRYDASSRSFDLTISSEIRSTTSQDKITDLLPKTTYYYRIRELFRPKDGGKIDTSYSNTQQVLTAELPELQFIETADLTYSRFEMVYAPEMTENDLQRHLSFSFDSEFRTTIEPMFFSEPLRGNFSLFQHLGEILYIRAQYHLFYDSLNHHAESIKSVPNPNLYQAGRHGSKSRFKGRDISTQVEGGVTRVVLGTTKTENIQFYLNSDRDGRFYDLVSNSESNFHNHMVYFDDSGNKYLVSPKADLYIYYYKIPGTDYTLCNVRDRNNKGYIEFQKVGSTEIHAFDGLIFRMEK